MSYKVSDLKNPNDVRESWLETPMLDFLGDKLKRKEYRHLIKVGQGATAIGKSFFIRNKFCPEIFKEKDFILYLAPQTENIPVDEFEVSALKHKYMFTRDPDSALRHIRSGYKVVLGLTWAALCNASKKWDNIREEINSLSSRSAWIVDECHSWLGVSAQAYYREVIGHRTPKFGATAMTLCQQSMDNGNDLVFGFTATPTKQHRGIVGDERYIVLNEWCPVSERFLMTSSSKSYVEYDGYDMLYDHSSRKTQAVINRDRALDALKTYLFEHHIKNIETLQELSQFDPNIKPKLVSLIPAGGNQNLRLSLHVDDAVESLSSILLESGLYEPIGQYISVLTDNKKGFYDLEGNFESAPEQTVLESANDPNKDCQFIIVNNKAKAGVDVFNLTGICSLRIREPSENSCTELSRQIIGRATRLCTGHGKLLHEKYNYNFEKILREYCKDNPNVNKQVFFKTIETASTFRFDYPSTPAGHWDLSVTEFERDYAPTWDSVKDVVRNLIFDEELCAKCPLHTKFIDDDNLDYGRLNELFATN